MEHNERGAGGVVGLLIERLSVRHTASNTAIDMNCDLIE
jgi:hypothetical protein